MRIITTVLMALLLGGCADWYARAVMSAATVYQDGVDYRAENNADRRWIRAQCRSSLERQTERIKRDAGTEEDIRGILLAHYPGLVSLDAIADARDDPTGILSHAPICGKASE